MVLNRGSLRVSTHDQWESLGQSFFFFYASKELSNYKNQRETNSCTPLPNSVFPYLERKKMYPGLLPLRIHECTKTVAKSYTYNLQQDRVQDIVTAGGVPQGRGAGGPQIGIPVSTKPPKSPFSPRKLNQSSTLSVVGTIRSALQLLQVSSGLLPEPMGPFGSRSN